MFLAATARVPFLVGEKAGSESASHGRPRRGAPRGLRRPLRGSGRPPSSILPPCRGEDARGSLCGAEPFAPRARMTGLALHSS